MKFIYPPTIQWEGNEVYQRPQQLMKVFAQEGHRSIFMERGRFDGAVYIQNGVEVVDQEYKHEKEEMTTVLWVTHAEHYKLKDLYHADIMVFDYIDEASDEFAMWNNNDLHAAIQSCDIVTVVSQRLLEIINRQYPDKKTVLLPNAADTNHFIHARNMSTPDCMANIPKPIIGFMGSISTWIDIHLMNELTQKCPDYSFVFIGPDYIQLQHKLTSTKNTYFLGRKMYNELPQHIGKFDVATIPFEIKNMTHSSSPIKMYEYLAAGIPVISTPIQEAIACQPVTTALSAIEWAECIENILNSSVDIKHLQSYASDNSWQARIKLLMPVLNECANHSVAT